MKKLLIVGNWKSHKSVEEAHTFMIAFLNSTFVNWLHSQEENKDKSKRVVICPPTILVAELARLLEHVDSKIPIDLGVQDISPFSIGPHTGEVAASEVRGLVKYVILGHSERRREFDETDDLISKKVEEANKNGLIPIVCVQSKETSVPDGTHIIAYEPVEAIGSGLPDDPVDADTVAAFFKEEKSISYVLYGGSVTPENVQRYTSCQNIDGVLVGGASLDPKIFAEIIQLA